MRPLGWSARRARLALAALAVAACSNAGAGRVLTITGAGTVEGQAYFDANGNRILDGAEAGFPGVGVRLIAAGTLDTVARVTTDAQGNFIMTGVLVGNYTLAVDTSTIKGDTVRVTRIDTSAVSVSVGGTASVGIAISYPEVPLSAIDTLPLNTKVFVVGVALTGVNGTGIFGDSTANFADPSGAARVVGVRGGFIVTADSDRVLGLVRRDPTDLSLRALQYTSLSTLAPNAGVLVDTLTTAQGHDANGGLADAALVKLSDTATVKDTATIVGTHGSYLRMHVQGTAGPTQLEVRLDSTAGFFLGIPGAPPAKDSVGAKFIFSGILVPSGTAGTWVLKPRAISDQHP